MSLFGDENKLNQQCKLSHNTLEPITEKINWDILEKEGFVSIICMYIK